MNYVVNIIVLASFCVVLPAAHNPGIAHQERLMRIQQQFQLHNPPLIGAIIGAMEEQPAQRRHHPRRGYKHDNRKKPIYFQQQHYRNNNRADYQRHAQINMHIQQPKQRNQKRLVQSYQRV